jgi:hypothetical protein
MPALVFVPKTGCSVADHKIEAELPVIVLRNCWLTDCVSVRFRARQGKAS